MTHSPIASLGLAAASLLPLSTTAGQAPASFDLLHADPMASVAPRPAGVLRQRAVRVAVDPLARLAPGGRFRVELFADQVHTAVLDRRELFDHGFHARGRLLGHAESDFVITVVGEGVAAWFSLGYSGKQFALQGASGTHLVIERDPSSLKGSCGAMVPSPLDVQRARDAGLSRAPADGGGAAMGSSVCNDDPSNLTVLVVYDSIALSQAGGVSQIQAWAARQVAGANEAFRTTEIPNASAPMTYTIAGYLNSGRAAIGTMSQELEWITYRRGSSQDPAGLMDNVHAERARLGADLVVSVVGDIPVHGNVNKTSWIGGNANFAFSVTEYSQFASRYDFAHITAHHFGCDHNRELTTRRVPYGHGWWGRSNGVTRYYFSIMSHDYAGRCGCTPTAQLPVFSGQRYVIDRTLIGSAAHDNRRMILENRQRIANYSNDIQGYTGPPRITSQPRGVTVNFGYNNPERVTFFVAASSAESYQWRRNRVNISGARSASLQISVANVTGSADYDCVVTNRCGSTRSSTARLSANPNSRVLRQASPRANVSFGYRVANVGDFNRDGYSDYGAAGTTLRTTNDGFVRIYSGRTGATLWTLWGGTADRLGVSFGAAGDIDADGYDDLLVGMVAKGRVRVYSGRTRLMIREWSGALFQNFGRYTAGNGDLNADGIPDVVTSGNSAGNLIAYSGKDRARLWSVAVAPITSVVIVGDVNHDGRDDIACGAAGDTRNRGLIEIRDGRTGAVLERLRGQTDGDRVGASLAAPGDLNNDGVADLVTGWPGSFSGNGAVWVYALRPLRLLGRSIGPGGSTTAFANSVAALGDYNNDGSTDFLASSSSGYVRVISGRSYATLRELRGVSGFGAAIAGIDSNGDARPDILVGSPAENRAWVYDGAPRNDPPRVRSIFNGCAARSGRIGRLAVEGRVAIQDTFDLVAWGADSNAPGAMKIGVQPWGLDLTPLGAPGCIEAIRTLATIGTRANAVGRARFRIPLGNEPSWIGLNLHWQGAFLSVGANNLASNSTNGVVTTIGRQ